jgi:integrase/recombinase XerD
MPTISDSLDSFIADMTHRRRLRPNTLRAYRYDLQLAASALPMSLDTIHINDIEIWLIQGNPAASTSNRRAASLGRFFTWAQRQGLCASNPITLREPGPVTRRLPNPIRSALHRQQLDAAIQTTIQPYRLVFTILRETGMRASEVIGLNKGDICLDSGREGLRIRETKNGYERTVILVPDATPRTLRGLRTWLRENQNLSDLIPLFSSNRKSRISYRVLYHQWQQLCSRAQLIDEQNRPLYTIHQLRHTRGTELIDQGYPMEVVQRILGHRDPRSTQGYAEVSDLIVRRALATHT